MNDQSRATSPGPQMISVRSAESSASNQAVLAGRLDLEVSVPLAMFSDGLASLERLASPDAAYTYEWDHGEHRMAMGLVAALLEAVPIDPEGLAKWLGERKLAV